MVFSAPFSEGPFPALFHRRFSVHSLPGLVFRALLRMDDFHRLPRGAFFHACFRSPVIHGPIPGAFSVRLFSVKFCMNFFAGPFLHVLFRSQGFFCINFRKAYTVGSLPVAFPCSPFQMWFHCALSRGTFRWFLSSIFPLHSFAGLFSVRFRQRFFRALFWSRWLAALFSKRLCRALFHKCFFRGLLCVAFLSSTFSWGRVP